MGWMYMAGWQGDQGDEKKRRVGRGEMIVFVFSCDAFFFFQYQQKLISWAGFKVLFSFLFFFAQNFWLTVTLLLYFFLQSNSSFLYLDCPSFFSLCFANCNLFAFVLLLHLLNPFTLHS